MAAPRGVPVRILSRVPINPTMRFAPDLAAQPSPSTISSLTSAAPRLSAAVTPMPVVPPSRVVAALAARQDRPGLVGLVGYRAAGEAGPAPVTASVLSPSPEVVASASASKEWGEAAFSTMLGDSPSRKLSVAVSGLEGVGRRSRLGSPMPHLNSSHDPRVPDPSAGPSGFSNGVIAIALGTLLPWLGWQAGFITSYLEAVVVCLAVQFIVPWLASRKAVREKAKAEVRQEAERKQFLERLRETTSPAPTGPAHEERPVVGSMPGLPGGPFRFLDSWPGAFLATGVGLASAVYFGLVTLEFLPRMAHYGALAVASLVLPAMGRDWLATRLGGKAPEGRLSDWSPRRLLSRVSPLKTVALPMLTFAFTGILLGRAKGWADAAPSSARRAASALAGPVVNAGLALAGGALAAGLAWVGAPEVLVSLVSTFIVVNVMTALVDLLPLFPSGGHFVLRHFIGHTLAAPGIAAWLDRRPGLQLAVMLGVLFFGGAWLHEAVLYIFQAIFWPAARASISL